MRKVIHALCELALVILLLAVSGTVAYYSAGETSAWEGFISAYLTDQVFVCCISVALFFLVILSVLTGIPKRARERYLFFSTEGGRVTVSSKGVASFIAKIADEFEPVAGLRARIVPSGKSIDVALDVKMREGVQIQEVCQLLQDRVRESLRDSLGIGDVRHVTVNVREITKRRKEA